MKLTGPDRLVIDIPNSLLDGRPRDIAVNSNGIKSVRAARYESAPPVTRVVVDLAAMQNFDVVPEGNKLVLKMRDGSSARPMRPTENTEVAAVTAAPAVKPVAIASAASPVQEEAKTASASAKSGDRDSDVFSQERCC